MVFPRLPTDAPTESVGRAWAVATALQRYATATEASPSAKRGQVWTEVMVESWRSQMSYVLVGSDTATALLRVQLRRYATATGAPPSPSALMGKLWTQVMVETCRSQMIFVSVQVGLEMTVPLSTETEEPPPSRLMAVCTP